jgi:anti-anti-sigma regulatory factor
MHQLHTHEGITVLDLYGELGLSEIEEINQLLLSLLRQSHHKMVLNFGQVEHVHYAGISRWIKTCEQLKQLMELKFAAMSPYTKCIFQFVWGRDLVENFDTVSEAMLSFQTNDRTWH